MEHDDETNWDSESDKPEWQNYHPAGMSDYGDWAEDNVDMGDHPSHADEPLTVRDKHIEGASSIAEVPTIATHPPDPTHLSMPEGSLHAEDDEDPDKPVSEGGDPDDNSEEEEATAVDVVIEEEYYKQQEEELDYEDGMPNEECEQVIGVNKSEQATETEEKQPTI